MFQQGQVFRLTRRGSDGSPRWAYRYRVGGRTSKRIQRGGFKSEQAAIEALERAPERLQRERGLVEAPPLRDLVDVYLAQHDGEPETVEKLRWLLGKAVGTFGHRRISQLRPAEIAGWRMTIPGGHRFDATQALRQVLARASKRPRRAAADDCPRRTRAAAAEWAVAFGVSITEAATSTCTTFATATGSPLSSRPRSRRSGASTISATRLRPSRSAPASRPLTSRATWEQASE